jgi:hypothetical protein
MIDERAKTTSNVDLEIDDSNTLDHLKDRSEQLTDVLTRMPPWLIRSGSGWFTLLLLLILAMSALVKYPEVIEAPVVITSNPPVTKVIPQQSGYFFLWVKDGQHVIEGEYAGCIKSDANVDDVLTLSKVVDRIRKNSKVLLSDLKYELPSNLQLGSIQETYASFFERLSELHMAYSQNQLTKKINSLKRQIDSQRELVRERTKKIENYVGDLTLARKAFDRDSLLFAQSVLSRLDFEKSQMEFLAKRRMGIELKTEFLTSSIRLKELEDQESELYLDRDRVNQVYKISLKNSLDALYQNLKSWEQKYLIKVPVTGRISLFKYWTNYQYVNGSEEIFSIIPAKNAFFVQLIAPINQSGKIKPDQKVIIKLHAYPYQQYGVIEAVVKKIALIPREGGYYTEIVLPKGLTTSTGTVIDFKPELEGTAQIITEDLSLFSRVFYRMRSLKGQ